MAPGELQSITSQKNRITFKIGQRVLKVGWKNYHPTSLHDKFHLEFKSRTRESNSPTSDYESDA